MVLRNPFTLISEDTVVPFSMTSGTGLLQPPKIVNHSSNRSRLDANAHACSGERSEDTETSTLAIPHLYPPTAPRNPTGGAM